MNSNRTWVATLVLIAVLSLVALGLFTVNYDALGSEMAIGVFASLVGVGVLSLFASVVQGWALPTRNHDTASLYAASLWTSGIDSRADPRAAEDRHDYR